MKKPAAMNLGSSHLADHSILVIHNVEEFFGHE